MLCAGQRADPTDGLHAALQHLHPDLGGRGLPEGRLPTAGCRRLVWRPAARDAAGHVLRRSHLGELLHATCSCLYAHCWVCCVV